MDKSELFKPRVSEADVDLPGTGWTVRVRALTRDEVISVRKATDNPEALDGPRALVLERKMLAAAMVDPELTEAEVGQWQKAAPAGELEPVVRMVQQLSGMLETAPKEAYKSLPGQPGTGA